MTDKQVESRRAYKLQVRLLLRRNAELTRNRKAFATLKLPSLPAEYAGQLKEHDRRASFENKFPVGVANLINARAVRLSLGGFSLCLAILNASTGMSIEKMSRLADCATFYFRNYRVRDTYNFSESLAKADSEIPEVNKVLAKFEEILIACGVLLPRTGNHKATELVKLRENLSEDFETALARISKRMDQLEKEKKNRDEDEREAWEAEKISLPLDLPVTEMLKRIEALEKKVEQLEQADDCNQVGLIGPTNAADWTKAAEFGGK